MEDVSEGLEKAPQEFEARQWAPADDRRRGKLGWESVMGPTELDSAPVGRQSSPDSRHVKAMADGEGEKWMENRYPGKGYEAQNHPFGEVGEMEEIRKKCCEEMDEGDYLVPQRRETN